MTRTAVTVLIEESRLRDLGTWRLCRKGGQVIDKKWSTGQPVSDLSLPRTRLDGGFAMVQSTVLAQRL